MPNMPPFLQLHRHSFGAQPASQQVRACFMLGSGSGANVSLRMCPVQGQCCVPGILHNFNTGKGFKELDKGAAMQKVVLCNTTQAVVSGAKTALCRRAAATLIHLLTSPMTRLSCSASSLAAGCQADLGGHPVWSSRAKPPAAQPLSASLVC